MLSEELSYVSARDPAWKRWTMHAIENASGRRQLLPIYHRWRDTVVPTSPRPMGAVLDLLGTRLDLHAQHWPIAVPAGLPLVVIANHPFGIGDGLALLSLAEQLDRPYRILINNDFMKLPEVTAGRVADRLLR